MKDNSHEAIIFFDGNCNLCNWAVDFVIRRDKGYFKFASLQSSAGKKLGDDLPDSVVLSENGNIFTRSEAGIRIAIRLENYGWVTIFRVIPTSVRDVIYDFIAKNRFNFFGRRNTCRLPTAEEANRFLA